MGWLSVYLCSISESREVDCGSVLLFRCYDLFFIPPLRRILHVEDESDDDYSDVLDNYDFFKLC